MLEDLTCLHVRSIKTSSCLLLSLQFPGGAPLPHPPHTWSHSFSSVCNVYLHLYHGLQGSLDESLFSNPVSAPLCVHWIFSASHRKAHFHSLRWGMGDRKPPQSTAVESVQLQPHWQVPDSKRCKKWAFFTGEHPGWWPGAQLQLPLGGVLTRTPGMKED